MDEARRARHDLRQHYGVLLSYADAGDYDAVRSYLEQFRQTPATKTSICYCGNSTVNAVVVYYLDRARRAGAEISARLELPEALPVPDAELAVLFGNLLENAVEALERQTDGRRFLNLTARADGMLVVTLDNSFSGPVRESDGALLSSKRASLGLGTASVKAMMLVYCNRGLFEQAGAQLPATWDELLAAGEKLRAIGVRPLAVGAGDSWLAGALYESLAVREVGAEKCAAVLAGEASMACQNKLRVEHLCAVRAYSPHTGITVQRGNSGLRLQARPPYRPGFVGRRGHKSALMRAVGADPLAVYHRDSPRPGVGYGLTRTDVLPNRHKRGRLLRAGQFADQIQAGPGGKQPPDVAPRRLSESADLC